MEVTFISHASILVKAQGRTILSDPWLESKVFNNGWALLSPPHPLDFGAVDYIWISHEHPDHLNFPTLKRIPPEHKRRITILYQKHCSNRIVDALEKLGFDNVAELPVYGWYRLEPGIELFCGSHGKIDSFLAIRDATGCILNLNDCDFNAHQLSYIKRLVGDVSVVFSQFSFANWVGNAADEAGEAEQKIAELRLCSRIVRPSALVPFASFVSFCNQENARMNAWINTPARVSRLSIDNLAFMYPGDTWNSDQPHFNSALAVERYTRDLEGVRIDPTPPSVALEDVVRAIQTRIDVLRAEVSAQILVRAYTWLKGFQLRRLEPMEIFVHDLNEVVVVDLAAGRCTVVEATPERARGARYVMCSQVAWYTFAFPWGSSTTQISGMYLDRYFAARGPHPFFSLQEAIASEVFKVRTLGAWLRTGRFWWRKRGEKFYDWTGSVNRRRDSADALLH